MNLKKFLHDHIPFLPHGSWKKAAESIGRKPQNFNEKSGWPHMVAKLEEAEKVLEAWGYEINIENIRTKLVDVPHFDGLWKDPESVEDAIIHAIEDYYEGFIPGELYEFVNFIRNYKKLKKGGVSFGSGISEEIPERQKQSKEDFNNPDNYYHSP